MKCSFVCTCTYVAVKQVLVWDANKHMHTPDSGRITLLTLHRHLHGQETFLSVRAPGDLVGPGRGSDMRVLHCCAQGLCLWLL